MTLLLAVVASGLGALARYGLAGAVQRRTAGMRPWGTAAGLLAVAANVVGLLVAGLLGAGVGLWIA